MSTPATMHYFNTQSAIAQSGAREAKTLACKNVVDRFDPNTATVEQSQDYARCINHLYPKQLDGGEALLLKVAIVACFICAIYGARYFWKQEGDWFSASMGFMLGFCFGVVAVLLVAFCILGLLFLFT